MRPVSDDEEEYRRSGIYYEWMQEFDRQKNEVTVAILELCEDYPQAVVYAAMLDLIRTDYSRDLKEWYGKQHGTDYRPPRPDDA